VPLRFSAEFSASSGGPPIALALHEPHADRGDDEAGKLNGGDVSCITIADVLQSNGVIHVVDTVLLPM
jgi:hypothetical protein